MTPPPPQDQVSRARRRRATSKLENNQLLSQLLLSTTTKMNPPLPGLVWAALFIMLLSINNNYFVTLSHSLEPAPANNPGPQASLNINSIVNREISKKDDQNGLPPVVINQQQDRLVGVGSNISLECTARGKGLTFVWFQDEKNITTSNNSSSTGSSSTAQPANAAGPTEPASTTKLLEEKRYEIAEEPSPPESNSNITTSILYLFNLKLTDTSLFLCWVENASGYTMTNFSLTVTSDLPASQLNGQLSSPLNNQNNYNDPNSNSYLLIFNNKTKHNSWVLVVVLIIGLVLLLLFKFILSFKQNNLEQRSNSSQSSSSNDLKQQHQQQTLHQHQASSVSSRDASSPNQHEYGFIEHMRSGIINMDYHSMSPVIQFNQNTSKQQLHQQHQHQLHQQHLHQQQLSNASLLQHQYNPPMYSDTAGTIPDLYHAAAAIYNPPGSLLNGPPPPANPQTLMNHHQHHLQHPSPHDMMNQQQQQQQQQAARNNYQRNLDYDRFHIL